MKLNIIVFIVCCVMAYVTRDATHVCEYGGTVRNLWPITFWSFGAIVSLAYFFRDGRP